MAAGLNVSRGSFYWHFRDISDFRAQLLRAWQERTTEHVIQELEAKDVQPDRLKHLIRRPCAEGGADGGGTERVSRQLLLALPGH